MTGPHQHITMLHDVDGIWIVADGVRIARRGYPSTPEADRWVVLQPGWIIHEGEHPGQIVLEFQGTVH